VNTLVLCLVTMTVVSYGFILLVDPYSSVPFSLDMKRGQVAIHQQRYFYPALAKDQQFNSALIGNSNIRLLRPDILNRTVGGNWVNLAMNAASSWEQEQIFQVFLKSHTEIQNIFVGMDYLWCHDPYAEQRFVGARTEAGFPAWLYDDDPINDLPPLSLGSLQHAWWQALTAAGFMERQFGDDGYTVFTDPPSEYRLAKARRNIYGSEKPKKIKVVKPRVKLSAKQRKTLPMRALGRLEEMLSQLPENTRVILFFVPYHSYYQAAPGSRKMALWNECKGRVVDIAARLNDAYVLDFMIRSDITRKDSNYWDHKHYIVEVGNALTEMIGDAVVNGEESDNYRILHSPGSYKNK
jgi:hypothetical protein